MMTDGDNEVLAHLFDRLDQLDADNAQLRAVVDSLRRRLPAPSTSASGEDRGEMGAGHDHDQALSRRGMLSRLAGAGAAGLGLATDASVLAATPAGATHAGSLCPLQVIQPSPATTLSCPYCGGSEGGVGMVWWNERRLHVCGACRAYAALTFDRQVELVR